MTRHIISAVAAFVLAAGSLAAVADSHVRIVRLSSVEGQVQMDRATGEGLERAILNTPIVEGTRLVTGSDGLAEIEFENQSALRLTEDSEVKFSKLLMNDAGVKIDQIEVVKGLVYLDAASKGDDVYRLMVGSNSFLVRRDTEMRLSAGPDQIQVAVFKGEVQLENQPQPVIVGKKETLTLAGDSG
ncbi:MAG: FecR domain-containing protein [Candidatus Korobacteraceae bacterium]